LHLPSFEENTSCFLASDIKNKQTNNNKNKKQQQQQQKKTNHTERFDTQ